MNKPSLCLSIHLLFLGVLSAMCAMTDKDSTDKSFVDTFERFENIEHEPDSETLISDRVDTKYLDYSQRR